MVFVMYACLWCNCYRRCCTSGLEEGTHSIIVMATYKHSSSNEEKEEEEEGATPTTEVGGGGGGDGGEEVVIAYDSIRVSRFITT